MSSKQANLLRGFHKRISNVLMVCDYYCSKNKLKKHASFSVGESYPMVLVREHIPPTPSWLVQTVTAQFNANPNLSLKNALASVLGEQRRRNSFSAF
jgi:hypothetical protein